MKKEKRLSIEENLIIENILAKYKNHSEVLKLKNFTHHGAVSIYDHCEHVSRMAYYLAKKWKWKVNYEDLLIGSFLHDFYLYNWHELGDGTHRLHGFKHPNFAYINSKKYFDINDNIKLIIRSHMWPLTLFRFPKSKEAFIVCYADKFCTIIETFKQRKEVKPIL